MPRCYIITYTWPVSTPAACMWPIPSCLSTSLWTSTLVTPVSLKLFVALVLHSRAAHSSSHLVMRPARHHSGHPDCAARVANASVRPFQNRIMVQFYVALNFWNVRAVRDSELCRLGLTARCTCLQARARSIGSLQYKSVRLL